jgi:hypothetical protein
MDDPAHAFVLSYRRKTLSYGNFAQLSTWSGYQMDGQRPKLVSEGSSTCPIGQSFSDLTIEQCADKTAGK